MQFIFITHEEVVTQITASKSASAKYFFNFITESVTYYIENRLFNKCLLFFAFFFICGIMDGLCVLDY